MAVGMTLNQLYAEGSASSNTSGPVGRSKAAESNGMSSQHHPHAAYQVAPAHYHQQAPPQQYGYTSQYPHHHHSKDDYAADPLPFEYHGARKYPPPDTYHHHPGVAYSSHPQQHMGAKSVDDRYTPSPSPAYASERSHYHPASEIPAHFPHSSHSSSGVNNVTQMYAPPSSQQAQAQPHALTHSFPPLIDPHAPKKESSADVQPYVAPVQQQPGGASQEAMIKVKTPLKVKYWRNGRRNLQCFPSCKVFGDYSAIKIEDLKQHDFMWGKCRGSIVTEVTLNSNVSFDDIVILGRVHSLENIPVAFEEAVIRECMLGRMVEPDVMDAMKDQWISGERLPDFVQQDSNTACFEFKPKVWKYTEDMAQGKCKRRNVKYYVQFEAFVLVMAGERRYYACIGSGMSTSFEVGSSRVLARQKRKAATSSDDLKNGGNPTLEMGGMQAMHHPMMAPHNGMMGGPPHGMAPSGMFQSNFHHQQHNDSRGGSLSAFAHSQLHQVMPQDGQQQPMVVAVGGGSGTKRKASSESRAAYLTTSDRASKLLKTSPQSMPL
uniref:Uncharacterized protein n=1 Tax=Globisporangium ultimum (strain ATCC 200006 / CBS 805.95 / DAOM BR144) TaxID=431595 RepID=K3WM99_GLOUD